MAEKGSKKKTSVKLAKKVVGVKKKASKTVVKVATAKKKKIQKTALATKEKSEVELNPVSLHPVEDELGSSNGCPPLEEKFFSQETDQISVPEVASEPAKDESHIKLKLSQSLLKKIKKQAEEEGISLEDFAAELLTEGVVLRAWEIVERKSQMRSPSSSNTHSNSQGGPNHRGGNSQQNRGNRGQKGGHQRGGMSHGRYQSIMDDKATFLEYVRNQERTRR